MFCHWWWMGDWAWQIGREDVNRLAKIMHTNIDIPALSTKNTNKTTNADLHKT